MGAHGRIRTLVRSLPRAVVVDGWRRLSTIWTRTPRPGSIDEAEVSLEVSEGGHLYIMGDVNARMSRAALVALLRDAIARGVLTVEELTKTAAVVVDLTPEAAGALVEALVRAVTIPREIDSAALDDSGANR